MKNRSFQTQEDPFSKKAQGISKIYHEVLLLMNFLQTKPQVKNMNIKNYDLYYTVIKNRKKNEVVVDKNEHIGMIILVWTLLLYQIIMLD